MLSCEQRRRKGTPIFPRKQQVIYKERAFFTFFSLHYFLNNNPSFSVYQHINNNKMVSSRPGSPYTGGRPSSANSVHTKVEEDLHEFAGIDYDKVKYYYLVLICVRG